MEHINMDLFIPKDFILILSGVPCVGKTTTAYNLLKQFPEFRRVSEIDIIRTVVRSVVRNLESEKYLAPKVIHDRYSALFESLSDKELSESKQQSKELIPYVKEIVNRQQLRKIPTIIEGSSIIPSTYFENTMPIAGFETNILFINLYLSDLEEHVQRRITRCKNREYLDNETLSREKINSIRNSKNELLHQETIELSKSVKNVFSIDVASLDPIKTINKIQDLIGVYLKV